MDDDEDIPGELKEHVSDFDSAITDMQTMLEPLLSMPRSEIVEKLGPLEVAKLDLVGVYSLNSLFWMYLNVCGINPKEHAVKGELDRIRSYMGRIKEAQDALSKPRQRVDKAAAERFIRRNIPKSALWENSAKKSEETSAMAGSSEQSLTANKANHSRPLGTDDGDQASSKKKRKSKHKE